MMIDKFGGGSDSDHASSGGGGYLFDDVLRDTIQDSLLHRPSSNRQRTPQRTRRPPSRQPYYSAASSSSNRGSDRGGNYGNDRVSDRGIDREGSNRGTDRGGSGGSDRETNEFNVFDLETMDEEPMRMKGNRRQEGARARKGFDDMFTNLLDSELKLDNDGAEKISNERMYTLQSVIFRGLTKKMKLAIDYLFRSLTPSERSAMDKLPVSTLYSL